MTLGPVMLDLAGTTLGDEEREMLLHPLTGGVILFTRNYESPEQLAALLEEVHDLRAPRLLVAVDHEGGRVQRFREPFTRLPPVALLGEAYVADRRRAKRLAETTGWVMATELRAVGVDFSFAPVLDLDYGVCPVIGDRAFHRDPEIVADLAHSYMIGMQHAGMSAVAKHFPGHGATRSDTHTDVAVDERSYADIYQDDIRPFERMIHFGLPAIMPAHVIYPNVDPHPAGFSRFWLQEVLRRRLEFQGAIFSDDLSMAGAHVAGEIEDRARVALDAGCDMVLVCNHPELAQRVLDRLGAHDDPASHMRLVRMHGRGRSRLESMRRDPSWAQAVRVVQGYDSSPELELNV